MVNWLEGSSTRAKEWKFVLANKWLTLKKEGYGVINKAWGRRSTNLLINIIGMQACALGTSIGEIIISLSN